MEPQHAVGVGRDIEENVAYAEIIFYGVAAFAGAEVGAFYFQAQVWF